MTTDSAAPAAAYPNVWQALLLVGMLTVFTTMIAGVLSLVGTAPPWLQFAVSSLGATALVVGIGVRVGRIPLGEVLALRPVDRAIWPPLVVSVVGLVVVLSEVGNLLLALWPMPRSLAETFHALFDEDWLGGLIVLAGLAPLTEEVLFRGLVLRGFLRRYPAGYALLVSSFLFALAHLNPWQFVSGLAVGVLLGWCYWQTGSLMPGIVAHALFNGLAQVATTILPPIPGFTNDPLGPVEFQPLWLDALGLTLTVVGLLLLGRTFASLRRLNDA